MKVMIFKLIKIDIVKDYLQQPAQLLTFKFLSPLFKLQ